MNRTEILNNTTSNIREPDKKVVGWKIWYTEGKHYSSQYTEWEDLPDDGILVLVLYFNQFSENGVRHRLVLDGEDYYFHNPGGQLFGASSDEDIDERYPNAVVKRGKWAPHDEFNHVKREAFNSEW